MTTRTVSKGVCRFDLEDNGSRGYMVRIMRQGKMYQEFFSDGVYQGKRKALKAAVARREELEEALPPIVSQLDRKTSRNKSGIVGVHFARDVDSRYADGECYYYVASWLNGERARVNVRFSWKKHGQRLAWQLACIAREHKARDRDKVAALHKRHKGRYPNLPAHPEIKTAINKGKKGVKKNSAKAKTVAKQSRRKAKIR